MRSALEIFLTIVCIVGAFMLVVYTPIACQAEMDEPAAQEEEKDSEFLCPFTKMSDNNKCMDCHRVKRVGGEYSWSIKEKMWRDAPYGVEFMTVDGEEAAYFVMDGVEPTKTFSVYEYCAENDINHVIIELHSPGGSVVDAWRVIGIIESYPEIKTTTKCLGMAASAGFVMLVSGDHRIASPRAMLMAHELMSFSFLKIERPSESKDEAEVMKLWQDNINEHLADNSDMTTEEIAEKMKYKDWWMTGEDAYKYGFIDELIWK